MRNTFRVFGTLVISSGLVVVGHGSAAAQPSEVSYQGHLLSSGSPFNGAAQFKFVIHDNAGVALWSNDGSVSGAPAQPAASVPLTVGAGLFSVRLGSTGMVPITTQLLHLGSTATPMLRVWVDTGSGFTQLPDQPLSSAPYALHSKSADLSTGPFTANGVIWSTVGGFKFPDGTTQATASAGGGVGNTLDQAYNQGGPGAGRTITANAGPVSIQGADGANVLGPLVIGSTIPSGMLSFHSVGSDDTTTLIAFDEAATGKEFSIESGFAGTGAFGNHLKLKSTFVTTPVMTWRGDGKVGIGQNVPTAKLHLEHASPGASEPALFVKNTAAQGHAIVADGNGPTPTAVLQNHGGGPYLQCYVSNPSTPAFEVQQSGLVKANFLQVNGGGPFQVDGSGRVRLVNAFGNGVAGVPIYAENQSSSGIAIWGKAVGSDATAVFEQNGTGDMMRGFLNGALKYQVTNSGRVVTTALQITGGGDLAEPFTVREEDEAQPGSVLVIDQERAGALRLATRAYDAKVAGIVSGAGGIDPGITLTPGEHQIGGMQVALSGRVYVRANTQGGPIRPGDLLTTSDRRGEAMRAADRDRSQGAVIGKAMTALEDGSGLVLVLVNLQ